MTSITISDVDLAGPDIVKFGVESKHSCPLTSTTAFQEIIAGAMRDMRMVCLKGALAPNLSAIAGSKSGSGSGPGAGAGPDEQLVARL